MKAISRIALGVTLLCVLLVPSNIFSCSYFIEPTFVYKHRPDAPWDAFNAGTLGILWPGFERRYLVIAYRYLDQKPLTAQERKSLNDASAPHVLPPDTPYDPDPPVTAWLKARSEALGLKTVEKIDIQRFKRNGFEAYPNCGDDAFANAARTAVSRSKTFAAAAMHEWVAGQDAVFQNCGDAADLRYYDPNHPRPPAPVHLPPPATLNNALLKFDRQYQLAAANFYGGDFDKAAGDLEQISQESDSPWHKWAPYLVARCYIRKATVAAKGEDSFSPEPMRAAEQRLQAILADKSLASMHPPAQHLLDYVEARLHPEQRLHAMATKLASDAGDTFYLDLFDYTYLLDHVLQNLSASAEVQHAIQAYRGKVDTYEVGSDMEVDGWRTVANKSRSFDDLTDWVLTFQLGGALTSQYRYERWQATKSTPWLLSALVSIRAGDPHVDEVERAAAAIAPDSPAYDTALYHRVRLLQEENKRERVRTLLDANWAHIEKDPPSSRNAFLAQRFAVANSFQEFLGFAPRTPVELEDKIGKYSYFCQNGSCNTNNAATIEPPPQRLELDSVKIFNQRLPLSMLAQAANGTVLSADLRDELAARMWLRAAILDDTGTVRELEPRVLKKYPEMRPYIEQYERADSADARHFALVFMVMHFSGMQPFVNPGPMGSVITPGIWTYSWWCRDVGGDPEHPAYQNVMFSAAGAEGPSKSEVPIPPPPSWLTAEESARGKQEWQKLSQIGAAPMYFAPVVLSWAKTHPDDARVPEALHYFVRATRYGCVDKSIGRYSREAFDLLHRKYPKSEWAAKTPYWFG